MDSPTGLPLRRTVAFLHVAHELHDRLEPRDLIRYGRLSFRCEVIFEALLERLDEVLSRDVAQKPDPHAARAGRSGDVLRVACGRFEVEPCGVDLDEEDLSHAGAVEDKMLAGRFDAGGEADDADFKIGSGCRVREEGEREKRDKRRNADVRTNHGCSLKTGGLKSGHDSSRSSPLRHAFAGIE